MTLDIQEAIRCYHEAVDARPKDHLILMLDKSLHMFPWESLPCLRGRSVSRLPTFGSLMERIVRSPFEGPTWPSVPANRGFFVLNPSGDLSHTQSQFENDLSKYGRGTKFTDFCRLPGWNGIVGRAPMDQEILWALANKSVFLYDLTAILLIIDTLATDLESSMYDLHRSNVFEIAPSRCYSGAAVASFMIWEILNHGVLL